MDPIKENVYMARLAEQAERYPEMVEYIKKVATTPKQENDTAVILTVDERNLLSVAYKNVVGARRASWRVLSSLEQKEENKGSTNLVIKIKEFRQKVEKELTDICNDILKILNETLIPSSISVEDKVFYLKMAGDYYRYLAEFQVDEEGQKATAGAKNAYENAMEEGQKNGLPPTSPIILGLALNYSVFFYEILNGPNEACKLAKHAFDQAVAELDSLSEEDYKDATLILQLLRDNLTLWTTDVEDGEREEEK
ncbi:hypothetical protein WA158_005602 [Blastocystis sp. Blastoise]